MLAEQTPASFIAFDLLALGDDDYTGRRSPNGARRWTRRWPAAGPSVHLTPTTTDSTRRSAGSPSSKVRARRRDREAADGTYQPDKRVMFKIKHERTADCVVAGYRRAQVAATTPIGSLLLGLYTDDGTLASSVSSARSRWPTAAALQRPAATRHHLRRPSVEVGRAHGGGRAPRERGSRWNASKDLSFVPLRPERVVEVHYEHMEGDRFRHPAQFNRWRPDRDPQSCTYEQLEQPVTFKLDDIVPGLSFGRDIY